MNATDRCSAIHQKSKQMGSAWWSLVFAAIAAYLVWSFGSGAPWWVYGLLFTRPVLGIALALTDDEASQKAAFNFFSEGAPKLIPWTGNTFRHGPGR